MEPVIDRDVVTNLDSSSLDLTDVVIMKRDTYRELLQMLQESVHVAATRSRVDSALAESDFLHEADKLAADQFWENGGNVGHIGSAVVTLMRHRIRDELFGE